MAPIDHKDEPGDYRDAVCAQVLAPFSSSATIVKNRADMVGTWRWRAVDFDGADMGFPAVTCQLCDDGRCISTIPGNAATEHEWALNEDGTISFHYSVTLPSGSALPTREETRFFLRALSDGRRILWNGDGSVVKVFEKAE